MEKNGSDWLGDLDIVGKNVIHDKFGSGVITEFNGNSLSRSAFQMGKASCFTFQRFLII